MITTIFGKLTKDPDLVELPTNKFYSLTLYQKLKDDDTRIKLQVYASCQRYEKTIEKLRKGSTVIIIGCKETKRHVSPDRKFICHTFVPSNIYAVGDEVYDKKPDVDTSGIFKAVD